MKHSLRTKLSLSHIAVAAICVFLISIVSNFFLEKQFRYYVMQNQEQKNSRIVDMIEKQYEADGKWETGVIQNIGISALEQGLIIKINDSAGKPVWDAMTYNNGRCEQIIAHLSENMISRYPNWKGGFLENSFSLTAGGESIGTVDIGYYGPFYYTDNDLLFINTLNKAHMGVGLFSLFIALIFGVIMSNRLSRPIVRVIHTARSIAKGYYSDRSFERSNTKELSELIETVNGLAGTLQNQESLRKRLTADVAHELRTPLAILQSHLEAMIDAVMEADEETLRSCHEETMRLNRMVGDIEKLSRYESESLILNKSDFDITELIKRILQNFENEFFSKRIRISYQGEMQMLYADRDKISQVLVNLLSNALKYTNEGGNVEISTAREGSETVIRVKDSGLGISKDDIEHIFERFYRADKSRNRMTGGSGIGLTIVKAIIEAHKGTVAVLSILGEGTEFIIHLPQSAE